MQKSQEQEEPMQVVLSDELHDRFKDHVLDPEKVKLSHEELADLAKVTDLPSGFLKSSASKNLSSVTSVDLRAFKNLRRVAGGAFYDMKSLKSLDMSVFGNVVEIGWGFCGKCTSLKTVDLSQLKSIQEIRHQFLDGATGIEVLDVEPLKRLTSLDGRWFLCDAEKDKTKIINADALSHLDVLQNVEEGLDCGTKFLTSSIKRGVAVKKAILDVSLVALKGKSRMSSLLNSHYVPHRLTIKFLVPGNEMIEEDDGDTW